MKRVWLFYAAALFASLSGASHAQNPCIPGNITVEGSPFVEAWVDQATGTGGGIVSSPGGFTVAAAKASPFFSIQDAINAVSAGASITNPGIVHLMPGSYEPTDPNLPPPHQTFPIVMRDYVSIQGTNARECILRGGGPYHPTTNVFLPIPKDNTLDECGRKEPRKVIVDFSVSENDPEENFDEMIDAVTFQGSDVQVYSYAEAFVTGRISNCIFDMVNYGLPLPGPDFGILTVHRWDPGIGGYHLAEMNVFNNTFVMAWMPSGSTAIRKSSPTAVGICDVNDPLCPNLPPDGDPDTRLRNIGMSNIQNNLFRELDLWSNAFLGGCGDDTRLSTTKRTNIFRNESQSVGGGTYFVNYRSSASFLNPVSAVNYDDPAFVGEMLTNKFGLAASSVGRDWRVLPDSVVIDVGVPPNNGVLSAFSPVSYVEPSQRFGNCSFGAIDSFDFDGEGYGNRRWIDENGDAANVMDVGFDEFERMIDSGYGNGSLFIPSTLPGGGCYLPPNAGAGSHGLIFKGAGSVTVRMNSAVCPGTSYTIPPGAALPPSTVASGILWFPNSIPNVLLTGSTTVWSYTPPDTTTPHSFGMFHAPSTSSGRFRLFQGRFGGQWSNLQTAFD